MCLSMSASLRISSTSSKGLKREVKKNNILSSSLDVKLLKRAWWDVPHLLSSIS